MNKAWQEPLSLVLRLAGMIAEEHVILVFPQTHGRIDLALVAATRTGVPEVERWTWIQPEWRVWSLQKMRELCRPTGIRGRLAHTSPPVVLVEECAGNVRVILVDERLRARRVYGNVIEASVASIEAT
jgi:hypothetical protein